MKQSAQWSPSDRWIRREWGTRKHLGFRPEGLQYDNFSMLLSSPHAGDSSSTRAPASLTSALTPLSYAAKFFRKSSASFLAAAS